MDNNTIDLDTKSDDFKEGFVVGQTDIILKWGSLAGSVIQGSMTQDEAYKEFDNLMMGAFMAIIMAGPNGGV